MFDTLGFLWLRHDSPQYLLYLLEMLVDGLSDECMKPPRSPTTTTLQEVVIGMNQSFNMKPSATHVFPCECGEIAKEKRAVVERYREQQAAIDRYRAKSKSVQKDLSAEQRRALELVAQRDGYGTVR